MPPLDLDAALARVASRRGVLGERLVYLVETPSTNDAAATLAARGAAEGTVVLAEAQTQGRGRLGRTWHSPAGAGLYLSVVFRPAAGGPGGGAAADVARLMTLMAGVAVADGIRRVTGLPVDIKWPNDLVVGRPPRKLAGLLAEASTVSGRIEFVILGIGLNLAPAAYPPDIADRATSLESELGRGVDAVAVLAETLAALGEGYADLKQGRAREMLDRWRALAPFAQGSAVEWESPRGLVRGTTEGIDEEGALVVRVGNRRERVIAGEVHWH